MAEFLATQISEYAAENCPDGDLASHIDGLIVGDGTNGLTIEERAWCSSFNQRNVDCIKRFPRVHQLLSQQIQKKQQKSNSS